ncbi:hypothetical protein SAMN04487949_3598 [Halogranum gelatinilyticum]|uniref:Uncharacterized protein n=1 Tax=Halogranum gelatinilyticum TaxID=660521 RepID=A0A1G9ZEI0_9EURY|nr:hypothetical protein [Halogranum gelatinilyticum]SDN18853.1 hypothetical protein SAMN04487949_3598 [Halogranum gelatinilyticum]
MHFPSSRTPEGAFEYLLALILGLLVVVSLFFLATGMVHLP